MPLLTRREVLLLKIETTYNTDAAPSASANALQFMEPSFNPGESARIIDRPIVRPFLGMPKRLFGGTLSSISFKLELKGSGTAGTVPALGAALRCCGWGETINASTSVVYKPESTPANQKSCTIWYYQDGTLHKLTGCRGNVDFTIEAGGIPSASFNFIGHYTSHTDASIVTPTFEATIPNPIKGATFTIGGFAAVINAMSISSGNKVSAVPSVTASDGFAEVRITDRDITGSMDPEMQLVATQDVMSQWKARTELALSFALPGSAGNILTITAPKVVYGAPTQGDREQIRTWATPFHMVENSGDDECVLTFT